VCVCERVMTGADGRAENLDDFQNGVEAMSARQSRSSPLAAVVPTDLRTYKTRRRCRRRRRPIQNRCMVCAVVYAVIVSGVTRRYDIIIIIIMIIIIY